MIESDGWLLTHASNLGIDAGLINAASADVCLGAHVIGYPPDTESEIHYDLEPGEPFTFQPGWFYLAHTLETVTVPPTHAAQLILKSSSGRKGLDHAHSSWIDPGFTGQVTYEFTSYRPVSFTLGQRIAQLIFMRLTALPLRPYGTTPESHYQGQTGVTKAWDEL